MKSIRSAKLFKMFILAIGVLGAAASPAYAQSASGTFTLTHETRWGGTALSAGRYTFSLQSPSLPAQLTVRKTDGDKMAIVLPQAVSAEQPTNSSKLVLNRDENGESFVSALYLGDLGVSLHYAPPKAEMLTAETAKLGPIAQSQPGK